MKRQGLTESPADKWTRPDDYIEALALRRAFRRKRRGRERTEPESPRLLLSTIPFLALLGLLAVLAVAIMVAAFPGTQPDAKAPPPPARQQGVAAKGWFEEAQRDFHH
jgi:hypothetical protein